MKHIIIYISYILILFASCQPGFAQIDEDDIEMSEDMALSGFYVNMDSIWLANKYEAYEYIPEVSEELIADRLTCIQKDIRLTYNSKIHSFVDYFVRRNREYSKMVLRRKALYFPIFEEALRRHGMPDELKYLAIVESGLKPAARSHAAAVGLWQFIPSTGQMYKLNVDTYIDDRMDPYMATEAACKYLKWLYSITGDWQLALASYNCGPGMVKKAIRNSGGKRDFWEIYNYLPQETRSYVPQFIAITYMMEFAPEHNLFPEYTEHPMSYDTTYVHGYLDLEIFSKQLNICMEDMTKLNPHVKKNIIPGHITNFKLRVPKDAMPRFTANKKAILDSASRKRAASEIYNEVLVTKIDREDAIQTSKGGGKFITVKKYHKVRKGDNLGNIADKYHVSAAQLKKWNNLKGSSIRIGQKLTINTTVKQNKAATLKASVYSYKSSSAKKKNIKNTVSTKKSIKYYKVQPGDTLWIISKKNGGIPVDKIKKLNKLKDNNIKPGQKLIVG